MAAQSNICTLCEKKHADRKNSHIVSLFIIANLLTEKDKARDNEVTATISSGNFTKSFIGRDVNTEKIDELFGREFTDKDIEKNINQFSVDYILCGDCETKLQRLESYVAEKIYNPFPKVPVVKIYTKYYKDLDPNLLTLLKFFFISVLWRASSTRFGTFRLSRSLEIQFKNLLNTTLSLDEPTLIRNVSAETNKILRYPFYIFCQDNTNDGSAKTNNVVLFNPFSRHPYYVAINEFVLCFYSTNKALRKKKNDFFGFEKHFYQRLIFNEETQTKLKIIDKKDWEAWREDLLHYMSGNQYQFIRNRFIELFVFTQKKYPDNRLVKRFMDYLIFSTDGLFDKYQQANMVRTVNNFFEMLNKEMLANR